MNPDKDHRSKIKKPAVICLGAGPSQVPVIKTAKGTGYAVLAVDRNRDAPGFLFSDEKINKSTHEAEPLIQTLEGLKNHYDLKGVLNRSSGPPVETAALLCRAFSLPGVSPEAARILVDKSKLMAFCAEKNIPAPVCISGKDLSEMKIGSMTFPMVVKPALSAVGKSGVSVISRFEDLPEAFIMARKASLNGMVNLEERVEGRDVALMAVVQNGLLHPITLLDELNLQDQTNGIRGFGFALPSVFSGTPVSERIMDLARTVLKAFDIRSSAFILSCRCDERHAPKLIEVHLDMGGDLILDVLLPESTSFDVMKYMCEMLIEDQPRTMEAVFTPKAVVFGEGEGLVTDRAPILLSGKTREDLETSILRMKKERNAKSFFSGMQP